LSDQQLLWDYVESRSEAAFVERVEQQAAASPSF